MSTLSNVFLSLKSNLPCISNKMDDVTGNALFTGAVCPLAVPLNIKITSGNLSSQDTIVQNRGNNSEIH